MKGALEQPPSRTAAEPSRGEGDCCSDSAFLKGTSAVREVLACVVAEVVLFLHGLLLSHCRHAVLCMVPGSGTLNDRSRDLCLFVPVVLFAANVLI